MGDVLSVTNLEGISSVSLLYVSLKKMKQVQDLG